MRPVWISVPNLQTITPEVNLLDVLTVAGVILGSVGASFVLLWLAKRYLVSYAERTETKIDDLVLSIIRGPVYLFIVVYAGIWLLRFLSEKYPSQIPSSAFPTAELVYTLVLVLVGTWAAYKFYGVFIERHAGHLARRTGSRVDALLVGVFGRLGKIIIVVIGVSVGLSVLTVDVTGLLAGLGIAGLALALALQDSLTNMISSIYIMVDRKYRIGDRIQLSTGELCDVVEVSLRATRLYNVADHTTITLPNNELVKMKIINWSEPDRRIKLTIPIDVTYQTKIETAKETLLDIASRQSNVLGDPAPLVLFTSFEQSSLRLSLTVWVDDFENLGIVRDRLNTEIKRRFEEEKIEIPYPTRRILMIQGKTGNERNA